MSSSFSTTESPRGRVKWARLPPPGFVNPIMPLIRYRTGDLAVFADRECDCGRKMPVIEGLLGRSDDVVVTPDGRRVGRLDPIFKAVSSFYESRIVQDAADHVRVEYVADAEVPDAERATLADGTSKSPWARDAGRRRAGDGDPAHADAVSCGWS